MTDETPVGWTDFTPRSRAGTGLRKRADQACFWNALDTALKHPDRYRYAEGVAWSRCGADQTAVHHAWPVTTDGAAIEVTWPWTKVMTAGSGESFHSVSLSANTYAGTPGDLTCTITDQRGKVLDTKSAVTGR